MSDRPVVVIHGWSDSRQGMLPLAKLLREALGQGVVLINLADYQSMDDEISFADVRTAMNNAWKDARLPTGAGTVDVVVHSTGGLVIRDWLTHRFHPDEVPIRHLLMLAPANFGSPLAHKGFSFIGRVVKGWDSVKPFQTGARLLKGLELASPYTWDLAMRDRFGTDVYYDTDHMLCTVLTGNVGYTGISAASNEEGSDGTVRVSTANMNCALLRIDFSKDARQPEILTARDDGLVQAGNGRCAFGIIDGENHGTIVGKRDGPRDRRLVLDSFRTALTVEKEDFAGWCDTLESANRRIDELHAADDDCYRHGYQNTMVLVRDDHAVHVKDYFLEFYADDESDEMASRFHQEAILTVHAHSDDAAYRSLLIDCHAVAALRHSAGTGLKVSLTARPEFRQDANVGYCTFTEEDIGAIHIPPELLGSIFRPHRTLLVELVLKRHQSPGVFKIAAFDGALAPD